MTWTDNYLPVTLLFGIVAAALAMHLVVLYCG